MCNGYSTYNTTMSFIVSLPLPSDMRVSGLWSNSIALSDASKAHLTAPGSSLIAASPLIAVSPRCVQRQCNVAGLLGRQEKGRWEAKKRSQVSGKIRRNQSSTVVDARRDRVSLF